MFIRKFVNLPSKIESENKLKHQIREDNKQDGISNSRSHLINGLQFNKLTFATKPK